MREAAAWAGVVRVVGDDPWEVVRLREWDQSSYECVLLRQCMVPALHRDPSAERVAQRSERRICIAAEREQLRHPPARAPGEREEPTRVRNELIERHTRLAARMIQSRAGDQRAEVPPPLARLREADDVRAQPRHAVLAEHAARQRLGGGETESGGEWDVDRDLGALDRGESGRACGGREAHRAAHIVVVGECERVQADFYRAFDQAFGVGGAVEQRKCRVTVELGVR